MARLRDDGIIVSRQGSGSYVKRRPDIAVLRFVPVSSIADIQRCFEFRHGLEGIAAALAAERWEDSDLAEIRAAFDALEASANDFKAGVDADERFHMAIAKATHNAYHVSVQSSLQPHIVFGMSLTRNLSLLRTAERLREVQDEHRAIMDAIAARDSRRGAHHDAASHRQCPPPHVRKRIGDRERMTVHADLKPKTAAGALDRARLCQSLSAAFRRGAVLVGQPHCRPRHGRPCAAAHRLGVALADPGHA